MANNNPKKVTPWKDKAKKYGKVVLVVLVAIWLFNIAQGAQDLAQQNKQYVQQPKFEVTYVPGGPERFKESFDGYLERTEKDIKSDKYLWSTLVVKNRGGALAKEINIQDTAAAPMAVIGYEDPGYGFTEINIKHESGAKKATINIGSLEVGETLKIFVGFNPQGIEKPYDQSDLQQWTQVYDNHQVQFNVKSKQVEKTLNLDGLPNLYN